MAGLMSQVIMMACIGSAPAYNQACNKALDAATRQVGVRQQVDTAEDKTVQIVSHKAQTIVGNDVTSVVGVGGFILKTARDRSLNFGIPTLGLCSSLRNQIGVDSYAIMAEWRF